MKILFVGSRDNNHSSFGGYDKIALLPNAKWFSKNDVFFHCSKNRLLIRLNSILLDLKVRLVAKDYDIVHFFYGDAFVRLPYKSNKTKFVTTLHLSFKQKKFFQLGFEKSVKSMNGVVVLSSQQKKEFLEKYGIRAEFIPHGFNEPCFTEIYQKTIDPNKINVLFIGQNYRDTKTFLSIIEMYSDGILFHCIGQSKEMKNKLKNYKNAIVYDRLEDDAYYSLIKQCDYNFLPLTFATANNALLEAQCLNVESILPDIDGISDYAAPEPLNLYYKDLNELNSIFANLRKPEKDNRLSDFSKKFEWNNVYKILFNFYESL